MTKESRKLNNIATFNLSNIVVKINGENKNIPQGISILKLLEQHKIKHDRVVIELNKKIINKENYSSTCLQENDNLEIVTFVGGG